jgi:hypothetical protein
LGVTIRANTLQITPEILNLIAELDEFKDAWQALGTLAPERRSAVPVRQAQGRLCATHFAIGSQADTLACTIDPAKSGG